MGSWLQGGGEPVGSSDPLLLTGGASAATPLVDLDLGNVCLNLFDHSSIVEHVCPAAAKGRADILLLYLCCLNPMYSLGDCSTHVVCAFANGAVEHALTFSFTRDHPQTCLAQDFIVEHWKRHHTCVLQSSVAGLTQKQVGQSPDQKRISVLDVG